MSAAPQRFDFACAVCGRPAGTITVSTYGSAGLPERDGPPGLDAVLGGGPQVDIEHHGHGACVMSTDAGGAEAIAGAARRTDYEGLRRIDPELVAFACLACRLAYCVTHRPLRIKTWGDDPYDAEWRAVCPRGHEQYLDF